jgi:hypothetical protein
MYINKIHQAGDYVLVSNYTPRFFGAPSRKRREKMRDTPEAMAKYNNHKRAEKLQLLMLLNFDKGYHLTLDYPIDERPETYEEAESRLKKFLYKMSRKLKAKGEKFKYIAITERGKRREALHHHMIIEGDPLLLKELTKVWGNHIKISQMYEEGAYKDLADYFCKIETKEEQTKGKSKYHRSRNLKEPTTKSRIVAGPLNSEPVIPKGYELVRDSLVNGFNEYAGIRYQRYLIRKKPEAKKHKKTEERAHKKRGIWESIKKLFRR